MATSTPPMTADDLLRLPRGQHRYELVEGTLITMSPAGFEHGEIGSELLRILRNHCKSRNLGVVVGPDTGLLLQRDPDLVRSPDVSFVRKARLPATPVLKFFPGAPDLAVEVVSPIDTVDDLTDRIDDYFRNDTSVVWIVKPRTRTVEVLRAGRPEAILRDQDTLTDDQLLPGFAVRVADLFQWP